MQERWPGLIPASWRSARAREARLIAHRHVRSAGPSVSFHAAPELAREYYRTGFMNAIVTALVRLLMGALVMAFLIILMGACARPPERNIWREMYEAGEL